MHNELTERVVPGGDDEHEAEGLWRNPRRRGEIHELCRNLNQGYVPIRSMLNKIMDIV